MSGVNKVILIGNLGADPEMRYTANGSAVTSFRIACTETFTANGEKREQTEWVSIVCWNKLAENVATAMSKGRKVYVEGKLRTRSWEGPDGATRYRTEVVAQEVTYLDRARDEGGGMGFPSGGDLDPDDLPFE